MRAGISTIVSPGLHRRFVRVPVIPISKALRRRPAAARSRPTTSVPSVCSCGPSRSRGPRATGTRSRASTCRCRKRGGNAGNAAAKASSTRPRRRPRRTHDADAISRRYPHGQLLVAGPAIDRAVAERATDSRGSGALRRNVPRRVVPRDRQPLVVVIVPTADVALPPDDGRPLDRLLAALPPFTSC